MDTQTEKLSPAPPKGPFLLCILDGVGLAPAGPGNAVAKARTPVLDELFLSRPWSKLITHGVAVGLPEGQMGNSEVGHMTIGSGRVVLQPLERINRDIAHDLLAERPQWLGFVNKSEQARAIHLVGLVSKGGVHSHTTHALGLCNMLNTLEKPVYVHAMTDGRDTAPDDAAQQLKTFQDGISELEHVYLADICGRFYAMDRDNRWERTEEAYQLYTSQKGRTAGDVPEALRQSTDAGETDEFIRPTAIHLPEGHDGAIKPGDAVIFFNFRSDRMRQIVRCFIDETFEGFTRDTHIRPCVTATLTEYDQTFNDRTLVLYPPDLPQKTLGEVVSNAGLCQLRIAETEKYAHVTFFLNGGREQPFKNEDRIVVPSPKVRTYDLQPEMSLPEVTQKLVCAIEQEEYNLIVLNIANGDQVGHSGVFDATVEAIQAVDGALGTLLAALLEKDGQALITADHGNCEEMLGKEGEILTAHTTNPVPLIYVGNRNDVTLKNGTLADIAPTILKLMGLEVPGQMEGACLWE